jgi:phosphatidylglycerophosphatase A
LTNAARILSDWIATVFRVGYLPLAPGTWGSLFALSAWVLLPVFTSVTYLAILGGLLFLGILTSKNYSAYSQKTDPSEVVIDEWLGMWIALYAVPKEMTWMIVSFLLFRFFDVVKVPPARQLERMHGGWGIMMDDVAAGLYALGLTHLLIWVMQ